MAEAFFRRKGVPRPGKKTYGSYASLVAQRGDFDALDACFRRIEKAPDFEDGPGTVPGDGYHFDLLIAFLNLYYKYRDRLTPAAVTRFKDALAEACAPPGRIYRYDFSFANTNHPFKCATIQVLAGEILGARAVRDSGLNKLRNLSRKLAVGTGRPYSDAGYSGTVSEFNSPTYSAPQLIPAALLGNFSQSREVRAWGTLYQELIFTDVLSHWHAPTQQSSGPHSRSYTENTIGGTGLVKYVLHVVLPGGVFFDPETAWWSNHAGDLANAALVAAVDFHVPEYLLRLAAWNQAGPAVGGGSGTRAPFPRIVKMRTSTSGYVYGLWTIPPGPVDTYSYQAHSYTLGSASRPTGNGGQMDSPLIRWRTGSAVRSMSDHKAAFFRYRTGGAYSFRQGTIHDQGIKNVLQHENAALALYRPLPFVGPTSSLRLDICIPLWAPVDGLWIDRPSVDGASSDRPGGEPAGPLTPGQLPVSLREPGRIVLQDGPVAVALQPLAVTDLGREHAVEIAVRENVLVISLINYQGEARRFPAEELLGVRNGVIILVDEQSGDETPVRLIERLSGRLAAARITDEMSPDLQRTVTYDDGTLRMSCRLSHLDADFSFREVNGAPYETTPFCGPHTATVAGGTVRVGDAALENASPTPLRLMAFPDLGTYAVYNFYPEPASFTLRTPHGSFVEERFGTGKVVCRFDGKEWTTQRLIP